MSRNIWKGLVLLLLFIILLTACDSERIRQVTGLVTELQVEDNGDLTGFVIRTYGEKEIGILLTEKTDVYTGESGSWTLEELRAAFRAALRPDAEVYAHCIRSKRILTTDSGEQITAYEASYVSITGRLCRSAVTMRDGTPVDVIEGIEGKMDSNRTYRLADGTELLRVNAPHGPENSYVGGVESFDDLSETVRGKVLAYFEQRGLLYDKQEELEKAYTLYQKLGEDFQSGRVEQSVYPSASSDRVMYFFTAVTLPTGYENGNIGYGIRLSDAFDRETGDHIDTWDLFTAPKNTVMTTILDECGIDDQPLRAEMEATSWDGHIVFSPDSLSVEFEPGVLPSEARGCGIVVDLDAAIRNLLQDWAVPKSRD